MKFSKFSLMPLLALALVACNVGPTPSSESSDQPTSTTSVVESSSNPSSDTSETQPSTESEPPASTEWSTQEQDLFKKYLNGNVIPYSPVEGAILAELEDPETGKPFLAYVKPEGATTTDVTNYVNVFLGEGYQDLTEVYQGDETFRVVAGPLANVEYNESVLIVAELYEGMFLSQFIYDIDVREWPGDMISINVEAILGAADVEIPAPTFTFTDVDYYANKTNTQIIVDIYAETDVTAAYEEVLTASNWAKDSTELWHDPSKKVHMGVVYYADYGCTSLEIRTYKDPTAPAPTAWNEEEKDTMRYFLNDNLLPFVYIEGAELMVLEDSYGDLNLVYGKLEGATQADLDKYCTELLKVEGVVDVTEAQEGDAANRFLIIPLPQVELHESIIVYAWYEKGIFMAQFTYDVDVTVWPSEDINGLVAVLFETTATVPAPSFAFNDLSLTFFAEQGAIIADLEVSEDPTATYAQDLANAGYLPLKNEQNACIDSTGKVIVTYAYHPDEGVFRIVIIGVPVEPAQ